MGSLKCKGYKVCRMRKRFKYEFAEMIEQREERDTECLK